MNEIDHIGIAVKSLQESSLVFQKLLGVQLYKQEAVDSEKVLVGFLKTAHSKIELLEATTEDSAIAKFLQRKGEGVHHIAFKTDDIFKEMDRLKAEGFKLLSEVPKPGADNKLVCFVHPKDTNGVLIEICQDRIG